MPELAEIYSALLDGAIAAVEKSEREHLTAQVDAVKQAASDGQSSVEDVLKAFAAGWSPDYFIGAELQIDAQLVMSTNRSRSIDGKGGVAFGPVTIEGSLSETFQQGTQTNLAVSCTLKRQSRNAGLNYALQQLGATSAAPTPLPTGKANG